jgi:HPt (histidine-containing phosphotransfer) domain-containing protein
MNEERYKYISFEYINDLADGDENFMEELIETYLTSIPKNLIQLHAVVEAKDQRQVAMYAHKLKGSFNFLGCKAGGERLSQIENTIMDQPDYVIVKGLLREVDDLSDKIIADVLLLKEDRASGSE